MNKTAFEIEFYDKGLSDIVSEITEHTKNQNYYIVTPNINHIVQLDKNRKLRDAYAAAKHRLCDSKILFPLLKMRNISIKQVIPGSTLTESLINIANQKSWDIVVIGCNDSEIDKLKEKYRSIKFHHHNPPMGFIEHNDSVQRCIDFILDHPSNLIIYSVGCPKQEILAHLVFKTNKATGVGLCVGASLHFLSGKIKRAPTWMQKAGLEWLHRIITEPRRLAGRYISDAFNIIPLVAREFFKKGTH